MPLPTSLLLFTMVLRQLEYSELLGAERLVLPLPAPSQGQSGTEEREEKNNLSCLGRDWLISRGSIKNSF